MVLATRLLLGLALGKGIRQVKKLDEKAPVAVQFNGGRVANFHGIQGRKEGRHRGLCRVQFFRGSTDMPIPVQSGKGGHIQKPHCRRFSNVR